jgi:hypothetical protein
MAQRKIFRLLISISLSFLIFVIGCSNDVTSPSDSATKTAVPSKFSEIQRQVFTPSCASSGCHGGSSVQANLNLSEGNSYNNLINEQSLLNPNFFRVKPGDSENSFLIKMLKNTGSGSSQMPPSGKLSDGIIDSIVVWINNGALNN